MAYVAGDREVRLLIHDDSTGGNAQVTAAFANPGLDTDLMDDVEAWMDHTAGVLRMVSGNCHWTQQELIDLTGVNAPILRAENVTGGASSNSVSPQVAHVWTLRTGLGGRKNRGRQFWPNVGTDWLASGGAQWNPTHTPTLQSIADDALAAGAPMPTSGALWCVNSRSQHALVPITQVTARTGYLGTQRRRAEQFM